MISAGVHVVPSGRFAPASWPTAGGSKDLDAPFYGANRPGAKVSPGLRDSFWLQGLQAGFKGVFDCIKAFSETDFTADLKKFDVPTLIIHGDDDQIMAIGATALLSSKLVKGATLKIYPRTPTACARPSRTGSTQICWRSSRRKSASFWGSEESPRQVREDHQAMGGELYEPST